MELLQTLVNAVVSIAASMASIASSMAKPQGQLIVGTVETTSTDTGAAGKPGRKAAQSTAPAETPAKATPAATPATEKPAGASFKDAQAAVVALSKKSPEEGGGRDGVMRLLKHFLPNEATPTVPKLEALNKHQEIIDFASKPAEDDMAGLLG